MSYYGHFDALDDPFEEVRDEEDEEADEDDFDFDEVIDDLSEVWEPADADVLQRETQRVEVPVLPEGNGQGEEPGPSREVRSGERPQAAREAEPVGGDKGRTREAGTGRA